MSALFLILAAMTIAGTAAAMSLRNAIHCILALTVGLVGLALLFLQLDAQFVGFTQIIVYVGAVAILAVFAIMMTRGDGSHHQPVVLEAHGLRDSESLAGGVFTVLALRPYSRQLLTWRNRSVAGAPVVTTVNADWRGAHATLRRLPLEIIGPAA